MNENKNNMSSMNEDENTVMASSLTKEEGAVTLILEETNTENEVSETCVDDCESGCDHDCSLDDCTTCNPDTSGEENTEVPDGSNTIETAIPLILIVYFINRGFCFWYSSYNIIFSIIAFKFFG